MSWFNLIQQVYSPKTLDTRFVIPSGAPPAQVLVERDDPSFKPTPLNNARPAIRWSMEFWVYYTLLFFVFPLMLKTPLDVSQRKLLLFHSSAPV
jgi:hypothetical protein